MNIRFAHTNIIAKDWKRLSKFYIDVFDCKEVLPARKLSGVWLSKGVAVNEAELEGIHLQLPGYDNSGPTLEIFQYNNSISKVKPSQSNQEGFGHIAFKVDKIQLVLDKALKHGAKLYGEMVEKDIDDVGKLCFIYIKDPEDNIIEIQSWS